ncbi:hypothetical protein LBYZC6_52110 [Lacrimispora brassicae]
MSGGESPPPPCPLTGIGRKESLTCSPESHLYAIDSKDRPHFLNFYNILVKKPQKHRKEFSN